MPKKSEELARLVRVRTHVLVDRFWDEALSASGLDERAWKEGAYAISEDIALEVLIPSDEDGVALLVEVFDHLLSRHFREMR